MGVLDLTFHAGESLAGVLNDQIGTTMSTQHSTGSVSNARLWKVPPLLFDLTLADGSALSFFSRRDHSWLKDGETVTVEWDTDAPQQAGRREALEVLAEEWHRP